MHMVTIQSGTVDELAGVSLGSGNVWARPEHGGPLSVSLAVGEDTHIIVEGGTLDLGGALCTLERIESTSSTVAHLLHFRIDTPDSAILLSSQNAETHSVALVDPVRPPVSIGGPEALKLR